MFVVIEFKEVKLGSIKLLNWAKPWLITILASPHRPVTGCNSPPYLQQSTFMTSHQDLTTKESGCDPSMFALWVASIVM